MVLLIALKSCDIFECKDILAGKILMYIFVEYILNVKNTVFP